MDNDISNDKTQEFGSPKDRKTESSLSSDEKREYGEERREDTARGIFDFDENQTVSGKFENPLAGIPKYKLLKDVEKFCRDYDMMDIVETVKKGALVAQAPTKFREIEELSDEDVAILEHEKSHKWSQPFMLYWLTVMCAMGAATQGMDETCNAGAVAFYPDQLGITSLPNAVWIKGLVVGAPYLACAVIGCWLNEPLNYYLARRGTIFSLPSLHAGLPFGKPLPIHGASCSQLALS